MISAGRGKKKTTVQLNYESVCRNPQPCLKLATRAARVCQSHPDLCRVEEIIEISGRVTSPCDMRDLRTPSPCEVPHPCTVIGSVPPTFPKTATSVRETAGHVTELRFKEVKSAFMGNYANLCCEIGVKNLSPKTLAKLPFLIGNLFQVDSHLLSSPTVTDKSYLLPPRGY